MSPEARDAWLAAVDAFPANPGSPHRLGARADRALQQARERLGALLGCDPGRIIWTSGATESANAVFHHLGRAHPRGVVCVSPIEHPCVLESARRWFGGRRVMPGATRDGVVDVAGLRKIITNDNPVAVALMAANNETGVIQPWLEAAALCREAGAPFFCDATQWLGRMPAGRLGVSDFAAGAAHKFGGPRGVGFLITPERGPFHALLAGGPQEEGRRAGTENVAGVLSMMAALEARVRLIDSGEAGRRALLKTSFEERLVETLPGVEIVGTQVERLWNTTSALMPEADCRRRWVVKLDKLGLAVSTGSACSSGKEAPSHVLTAMGFSPGEAGRMLRFSAGWETTGEDWSKLLAGLNQIQREAG